MWRHSLKNWEKVNKDVYKFCFEQAEKRLKDILDDSEKITNRAYTLMGILVPLLSICVGIVIKRIENYKSFNFIEGISFVGIIVLGLCLIYLSRLIKSRDIWFSGTEPQDILLSHYVEIDNLVDEEPLKYMYLSELESIQYKIDQNKSANEVRVRRFNKCLLVVILAVVLALAGILSNTII